MAVSVISREEFQRLRGIGEAGYNDRKHQRDHSRSPAPVIFFRGKDDVYSNFYEFRLSIFNRTFFSAEAAYQYSKAVFFKCWDIAEDLVNIRTGLAAKAISHSIEKSDEEHAVWGKIKPEIMKAILYSKVEQCPQFRMLLTDINLRNALLVENTEDEYWGYSSGKGYNMLGRLLMTVRQEFVELIVSPKDVVDFRKRVMLKVTDKWPNHKTWRELCKSPMPETEDVLHSAKFRPISPANSVGTNSEFPYKVPVFLNHNCSISTDDSESETSVIDDGRDEDFDLSSTGYSEENTTPFSPQNAEIDPPKLSVNDQRTVKSQVFHENTHDFSAGFFLGFIAGGLLMQYYHEIKERLARETVNFKVSKESTTQTTATNLSMSHPNQHAILGTSSPRIGSGFACDEYSREPLECVSSCAMCISPIDNVENLEIDNWTGDNMTKEQFESREPHLNITVPRLHQCIANPHSATNHSFPETEHQQQVNNSHVTKERPGRGRGRVTKEKERPGRGRGRGKKKKS